MEEDMAMEFGGDLTIAIDSITLPPSATEPLAPGSVDVTITNEGTETSVGEVDIDLFVSSDKKPNTRVKPETGKEVIDGLLGTVDNFSIGGLEPGESISTTIDYENITGFVPPSSKFLVTEVVPSVPESQDGDLDNNTAVELVSADDTDVMLDWVATGMNVVSNQFLFDEEPEVGAGPPEGTRAGALLTSAMYNAFGKVTGEFEAFEIDFDDLTMPSSDANVEAAMAGAAYTVLKDLFPEQKEILDAQLDLSLEEIEGSGLGVSEMLGLGVGEEIGQAVLDNRADELEFGDDPDISPFEPLDPEDDFFWTPEDNGSGIAVAPQYGEDAEPYAIESSDSILELVAPDPPDSDALLADMMAVATLGGAEDTAETSITRTDDQTEIAKFYFVDRGDSYKPNKHLNHILQEIAIDEGLSLKENTQLFFLTNIALADGVIVAWDGKYEEQYPRPTEFINDEIDPEWEAELPVPGFPEWKSGHSMMVQSIVPIWEEFFGEDFAFDTISPDTPGVVRELDNFKELAEEFSLSRVFAGVHTIDGAFTDPLVAGNAVGEAVLEKFADELVTKEPEPMA